MIKEITNIIKKDILNNKSMILMVLLIYIPLFSLAFSTLMNGIQNAYTTIITLSAYIWIINSLMSDEKYKTDILLNTLPIRRSSIVIAKTLLSDILFVGAAAIFTILGGLNALLLPPDIVIYEIPTVQTLCLSLVIISLFGLVNIPLAYKFGYQKSRVIGIIALLILIVCVTMGIALSTLFIESVLPSNFASLTFIIISGSLVLSAVIQLLTYAVSIKIYRKKDF